MLNITHEAFLLKAGEGKSVRLGVPLTPRSKLERSMSGMCAGSAVLYGASALTPVT